jgi:hypothetical protein
MSREAMKLALEALESAVTDAADFERINFNECEQAITVLQEALAKPNFWEGYVPEPVKPAQQEPVTWGVDWGKAGDASCVSIIKRLPDGRIEVMAVEYGPQRPWQGLTDEEVDRALDAAKVPELPGGYESVELEIARAIEAKLKEKNNG